MPRRSSDNKNSKKRRHSAQTRRSSARRSSQKNRNIKKTASRSFINKSANSSNETEIRTSSSYQKSEDFEKKINYKSTSKRAKKHSQSDTKTTFKNQDIKTKDQNKKIPLEHYNKSIENREKPNNTTPKHYTNPSYNKPVHLRKDTDRITPPKRATIYSRDDISPKQVKPFFDAAMRKNLIKLTIMVLVGIGLVTGLYYGVQAIIAKQSGFKDIGISDVPEVISTQSPRNRNTLQSTSDIQSSISPNPAVIRDISFGARDVVFKERHINIPGIYDNELLFSAGTGSLSLGGSVLKKLYLYNLDAGDETLIAETKIDFGEFYETLVNHNWLVWLETDHGKKNYIKVMNRSTGIISTIQSFKNGQPKLRLYDDLLIWMEQVSSTEDRLCMSDLNNQEYLPLFSFNDKASYGVSSPWIFKNTIVWAGPDLAQSDEDKLTNEHSSIYYLQLEADETGTLEDPKYFSPNTYVHEPLYNGEFFVWLDGNRTPDSNLYVGKPNEDAKLIATGVTTYSVGDGIVVYGKDQAVWVYITATEELCRLTSSYEMGMLPSVTKRTVVWYNLSAQSEKDVLRFKVLTDEELYPGGLD